MLLMRTVINFQHIITRKPVDIWSFNFLVICAIAFLFKIFFIIKCIFLNYLLLELLLLILRVHECTNGLILFLLKDISTLLLSLLLLWNFPNGKTCGRNLFPSLGFFFLANFCSLRFFKTQCALVLILMIYINFPVGKQF